MAFCPRHRNNQRIVADTRIAGTPRRQICHCIGPANADDAGIGGLPAVAAAAHPVIGIGQRHAANPSLTRERDRSVHRPVGVQIAGTASSVPPFERTPAGYQVRLGINCNDSSLNHPYELGKAVQAMRIDAVPAGIREEPR